jgi:8-hydroxy-5-deazaflavin:NADPH oxidoreductase
MKKIGVLGSGAVGKTLADGFIKLGNEVMRGSRDGGKLADWKQSAGDKAKTGTFAEAARFGDVVVLAVKGTAAEACVETCAGGLDGKLVLDTTNPVAEAPAVDGVLQYFTGPNESLLERLQKRAPAARFVKAFNSVGNAYMVNPKLGGQVPTMFICGNDPKARAETTEILTAFGWETADMGSAVAARAIEPLCMLWCIPGLQSNRWNHAFKLLKA